ncbi:GvpL/GvpF family gas vesicle protein [Streptomyces sp. RFCAC02]|uniref:GvpL/GvpF family gas vesicle protein n=1 Tax=Streptomyces sp. RFCAC02 TaxID=2499143 RepID=UPI0010208DAC|nr:GvpL/GvpF family gas vesicle protein [Streptomyces sp. RFCAC02]
MSTYVYGITHAGLPDLPEDLAGVGDPPRPVRVLREGDAAAVVSDCPEGLRPKRRDLFAHQRVLTAVSTAGAVLPLRFGSVSADDDAVRAELAANADLHRQQLETVAGRVEYNVKGVHREDVLLRAIVTGDEEIGRLNAATRGEGGRHEDRVRLGELVAGAVQAQAARDSAAVAEALAPHAVDRAAGPEGGERVVNLSFLVDREHAADFLTRVEQLQESAPHLELAVSGPLPPYSFVRTASATAA